MLTYCHFSLVPLQYNPHHTLVSTGVLQSKTTSNVEMSRTEFGVAMRTSCRIGKSNLAGATDSNLNLDDLRIYSGRDLSAADVAAIYAKRNA